nr:ATP-binding cassette sub-family A member 17-like [Onthophagus taurus]
MSFKQKIIQLKLLLWKNFTVQFRHPIRKSFEFIIPLFIIMITVITKRWNPTQLQGPAEFPSFKLEGLENHLILNKSVVYWSPCRNKQLTELMESILPSTNTKNKCFKNADDLQVGSEAETSANSFIVGIDFGDDLIGKNCIGDKMSITIRLPAEISSGSWHTSELFDDNQPTGPRYWTQQHGYDPDYYETGFLNLQYTISKAIINQLMDKETLSDTSLLMQRYPYTVWKEDFVLSTMKNALGIIIVLCLTTTLFTLKFFCGSSNNVFEKSSSVLVLLFFLIYAFAATAFCFMISIFFKREFLAAAVAVLLWYLSLAPYALIGGNDVSASMKMISMLSLNSALCEGVHLILLFEEHGDGWHWNDICKNRHQGSKITMCHITFMLIFDTILYLIIGMLFHIFIRGIFSSSKSWRIFHKPYWFRQNEVYDMDDAPKEVAASPEFIEPDPPELKPGIKIVNLTKTFQRRHNALDNLTLNAFTDQITILLGHNGCGKSTVINTVVGILPPTDGSVIIDEIDVTRNPEQFRPQLGWCPERDVLYKKLTVQEHITLFCRLKGLNVKEAKEEVHKYIELMKLENKKSTLIQYISPGMKRKISAIIAICGKSKVCVLDEPSSGMDPASRRDLCDILQSQKIGKTILMTTHYMDEAAVLGDRIAIMSEGKLQAMGSTFFLKKKYGVGYRLIIVKTPNCDVYELTKVMRGYIPTIEIENDVGNDLVYVLPEQHTVIFESLLLYLETNSEQLGIRSFSVSLTSIEDIFTKAGGSSYNQDIDVSSQHVSRQPSTINFEENFLKGFALRKNQIIAMLMKKFISTSRSLILFILPILILLIVMILMAFTQYTTQDDHNLPKLVLTNDLYGEFIAIVSTQHITNEYYHTYKKTIIEQNGILIDWEREDFGANIMSYMAQHQEKEKYKNLFGASFKENKITTWFNPEGYHVAPLALQYTMNTILQTNLKCEDCHLEFINYPLPIATNTKSIIMFNDIVRLAYCLGFAMVYVTAFFIYFYVKERAIKSKQLQFISGVNATIYWGVGLLWDYGCFLISVCLVTIFLICLELNGFSSCEEIGRVILLLLLFGLAALTQLYLLSLCIQDPPLAYGVAVFINFFLGPFAVLFIHEIFIDDNERTLTGDIIYWILLIFPHFALTSGIYELGKKYGEIHVCEQLGNILKSANSTNTPCKTNEFCCNLDDNYLSFNNRGIGKHLIFLSIATIFSIIIIYLTENRMLTRLYQFLQQHNIKRTREGGREDIDVMEERYKVKALNLNRRDYPVVVQDVTKCSDKLLAVNRISFALQEYECFALLGANGSGKTTTIKMIMGELIISKGNVWIYGNNLNLKIRKIYKEIGYCPQLDALLGEMTGKETLIMFSLLRGLSYPRSLEFTTFIAEKYDFLKYLNKRVKFYSNGIKKKLSTAIAMIGNPSILLLDEPTTGMDAESRRRIWKHLKELKDRGRCILIASHNMDECEAIATRLTIMTNGKLKCIGSPNYLKNKFSQFNILTVKMRPNDLKMDNVDSVIRTQVPLAIFQEMYSGMIIYHIPLGTIPWSKIFGEMERLKRSVNIDDYAVTQSSLEQVFLYMTRLQDR